MLMNTSRFKENSKKLLQKVRLRFLANEDIKRFSRSAPFSIYDASYEQLTSRIMYNVHSIEKGLSRTQNFRTGFGKKALSVLNDSLVIFSEKGYDLNSFPYVQGRSIIIKYIDFHNRIGFDISFLNEFVNSEFLVPNKKFNMTGTKVVYAKDKANNNRKNFYELAQERSSIREFSGESIERGKVLKAISNAFKTPSVCNRQGWKTYLIEDKEKIEELLYFQQGFKGYTQMPEIVVAITVSNSTFLSPVERNEAFVDGGLFSMSIIYGLEYESLAAVPLNAMMNSKNEMSIRKLIEVKEAEQIIMFIAIGAFKGETTVPISDRKDLYESVVHVN